MSEVKSPEAVNKSREQAAKRREAAIAAIAVLAEKYPDIFNLDAARPLKIGIHQDLQENSGLSNTQLRKALSAYTRHFKYIQCLAEGGDRIDLAGVAVAQVTEEEQQHAREKVAEIEQARSERKKQQQVRKQRVQQKKQKEDRLAAKLEALVTRHK